MIWYAVMLLKSESEHPVSLHQRELSQINNKEATRDGRDCLVPVRRTCS